VDVVVDCIYNGSLEEESLFTVMPLASCEHQLQSLQKASNAISRALPYSKWGSPRDHFGFKRCSTAVTAFKKVWNDNISLLAGGESKLFLDYAKGALDILESSVNFNQEGDNAYKGLCLKKLKVPVNKVAKDKSLTAAEKVILAAVQKELDPWRILQREKKSFLITMMICRLRFIDVT
jgi:hypothetical protein